MSSPRGAASIDHEPRSRVTASGAEFSLLRRAEARALCVWVPGSELRLLDDFEGEHEAQGSGTTLVGPCSPVNAQGLREHLSCLRPIPLGTSTSAGLGDRLGLATAGQVRAVRTVGGGIRPIFVQQSIREMSRTGRTPVEVMDDATWGTFAEGWRDGVGSDADHLKTTEDIDSCLAAVFTMFMIDPSAHVVSSADTADAPTLRAAVAALPWDRLGDTESGQRQRHLGSLTAIEGHAVRLDEEALLRALAKYGRAVAHIVGMARHLRAGAGAREVEIEVSVDETDTPTSPAEHLWVATELGRLGVRFVSLAPRFVGRFEKGVDYIGDLAELESDLAVHAAIARHAGPYKLSLHSGSDKFSVYGLAAEATRGLVHLKTAGTIYLEALRTVAGVDPGLFRSIYAFARERYETDRASYHVSARLDRAPESGAVPESELPALLEQFDAREILHVTFGSVLNERDESGAHRFREAFFTLLRSHPEEYARHLEFHFVRLLRPFAGSASR